MISSANHHRAWRSADAQALYKHAPHSDLQLKKVGHLQAPSHARKCLLSGVTRSNAGDGLKSQLPTVEMAIEVEVDYFARASVAHVICAAHAAHVAGGIDAEVEIPLYLIAQILRSRVCRLEGSGSMGLAG